MTVDLEALRSLVLDLRPYPVDAFTVRHVRPELLVGAVNALPSLLERIEKYERDEEGWERALNDMNQGGLEDEKRIATLEAALSKYGQHAIFCPKSELGYGMNRADGCRCGFDAAVAGAKP